jgi:drug/metabolite transporter (DMT)-like permease
MDPKAQVVLQRILEPGERLLWCGRPRPGPWRVVGGVVLVSFAGLLFGIGAAFFAALFLVLRDSRPEPSDIGYFLLLGPLVGSVVGLLAVVVPARRTCYGVTDRRVLIVRGNGRTSIPLRGLFEITLKQRSRGRGDIAFPSWIINLPPWAGLRRATLEHIEDARRVYDLIQETARASRT